MTQRIIVFLISILFLIFPISTNGSDQSSDPWNIVYPKITFTLPKAERFKLSNEMIIYFLEDHELPLVNISAVVKGGSAYDIPDKEGLAEIAGTVLRTGGTKNFPSDDIDEILDTIAATLSIKTAKESTTVFLSVLKDDIDRGFHILSDILINPSFEAEKIELAKKLKIEGLKRLYDEPQQLAFREFLRIVYGGNPRGKLPSMRSIKSLTQQDLASFHRSYIVPSNIIMAVSGDISKQEIMSLCSRYLENWQSSSKFHNIPLPVNQPFSVNYISKNIPQSIIITGQLGPGKKDPLYHSFEILDFIVGSGGFNSLIFDKVRNELGLAYSAGSFFSSSPDFGIFCAYGMTKSASTFQTLSVIRNILSNVQSKEIDERTLQWAKNSLINSFIFSFDSSHQIALQQVMLEFDNLPEDFLKTYRQKINNVSPLDIKKAAKKYLVPDHAIVLVLGNEKSFDKSLTNIGKVNRIQVHCNE